MNSTTTAAVLDRVEQVRAGTLVHEGLLSAAEDRTLVGVPEPGADLLAQLLRLHGPVHATVPAMFQTEAGQATCRGCDRAQPERTKPPAWPCRTYRTIAATLLRLDVELGPHATAVLAPPEGRSARRPPARHSPVCDDIVGRSQRLVEVAGSQE